MDSVPGRMSRTAYQSGTYMTSDGRTGGLTAMFRSPRRSARRALIWPIHHLASVPASRASTARQRACPGYFRLSHKAPSRGRSRILECRYGVRGPGFRRPQVLAAGRQGLDRQPCRRCRCSLRRLCAVQASSHSLSHAARPRRDIMVSSWQVFSWPNTGSTVWARILQSSRPR
jgi:hypothetical protein